MTRLVLWRHGQTDYNAQQRLQGQVDIPLNEEGLAQAQAASPVLAEFEPSRIVTSPLLRASQTAEVLADRTGVPVSVDERLIERAFGVLEGLTHPEMKAGWPEGYLAWRRGEDPQGLGIEPRGSVARRVGRALRAAAPTGTEETVVVVAHGSALTLGTTSLLGLDASTWLGLRGLDNCHHAVLIDSARTPGWVLRGWNFG